MVHTGCVFVAGIHPSRTWMSGSLESVWWNACVHRLDLGLYSHPKEFWENGVRTYVYSKEQISSTGKILLRGGLNPRRSGQRVQHYQRAIPPPSSMYNGLSRCLLEIHFNVAGSSSNQPKQANKILQLPTCVQMTVFVLLLLMSDDRSIFVRPALHWVRQRWPLLVNTASSTVDLFTWQALIKILNSYLCKPYHFPQVSAFWVRGCVVSLFCLCFFHYSWQTSRLDFHSPISSRIQHRCNSTAPWWMTYMTYDVRLQLLSNVFIFIETPKYQMAWIWVRGWVRTRVRITHNGHLP